MMKKYTLIVIADSAALELWEWLVFSRICYSCDIRQIQVLIERRKKIPLFYASHMVGLNAKLAKNSQLTVVECDGPVASDDIDFIFCFNRRSCEYLNSNVPVMFIERSVIRAALRA
jgi:hypothetical protein